MLTSNCPCCSHTLLRHIRSREVYWFCQHCHQEMPNYATILSSSTPHTIRRCASRSTKRNTPVVNALGLSYV